MYLLNKKDTSICFALPADGGRLVVDTSYGKLKGTTLMVKETDRTVDTFYGIPFAKPPVGPLRFAAPEPPEPWKSVREATENPPMCPQNAEHFGKALKLIDMVVTLPPTSEDCLYLNVFTPSDRGVNAKLPVMVFLHGGGLVMGTAAMYDGSAICAHENVVYVVIQYRLGILGFLSTGDGQAASGNYGLLDQVAALRWIQGNIKDFGGDPGSVTIFGESAGGISVSALVLSPLARGLFHCAIAQSGVAIMQGFMVSSPKEVIFFRDFVANLSGCEPSSLVDCLRMKSEQEISSIMSNSNFLPIPACVDGIFLPKPAEEILAAKENSKVPFIIGVTEQEFGWIASQVGNPSSVIVCRQVRSLGSQLKVCQKSVESLSKVCRTGYRTFVAEKSDRVYAALVCSQFLPPPSNYCVTLTFRTES
ncbi:hypothetical protein AB205_0208930 [Aquarana catesbeiana]|uniref:Carboxylic ester hydrolase n=1 Tax=Aquarana catesbeiana TaxID=8400 RepID=A0A2G9RZV4_AQUCT|nr:hypothetical protein AB205_0208930 [Aquarana catesbeiana]